MDVSKVERQAPAEERGSVPPNYLKILLQDMICFFVLLSLALLIVAGILYVADDVTKFQHSPRIRINSSRAVSLEEGHKHMHQILRPDIWFRLFGCQKQQDAKMKQLQERSQRLEPEHEQERVLAEGEDLGAPVNERDLDEQQSFGPYFVPTYGPNDPQAAGDHILLEPADNQLESEPKPSLKLF
ncbi:hypothetical protein KR032_011573 [Drosophila birchii]|nr:hypothetical protein KR032_011573 [Drosophila birchii]